MAPLRGIRPGDLVRVDLRGRVFYATVDEKVKKGDGELRAGLRITPLDSRINYRFCTASQVEEVYRRVKLGR